VTSPTVARLINQQVRPALVASRPALATSRQAPVGSKGLTWPPLQHSWA
jgi:hypothetical protein